MRNPEIFRVLHLKWHCCACCGATGPRLSLHHVFSRDDIEPNLVMLCGDGVSGCHGLITAEDEETRAALGLHIACHRFDTLNFVRAKLGLDRGNDWLERRLFVSVDDIVSA